MALLRSPVFFFHSAFCILGTRYVRAWNEIIKSYLFGQRTNYCFRSYVPSSPVCFCLAWDAALQWLLVAPLGADSEAGGRQVKDRAKKIDLSTPTLELFSLLHYRVTGPDISHMC